MVENDKQPEPNRVYTGTEQAPTFYANNVNVAVSSFDMRLRFALVEDISPETVTFKSLVTVYLSPGQARALRNLLIQKMGDHERIWAQQVPTVTDETQG